MLLWKAVYLDGHLNQYNDAGLENKYTDIDRSRLIRFELYDGEKMVHCLFLNDYQRLIFRRRNFISYANGQEIRMVVYLVGYQFNDATGKNYKVINYIHEDGLVELDNAREDLVEIEGE
jgi:hypothetical protein